MRIRADNHQIRVSSLVPGKSWRSISPIVSPRKATVGLVSDHNPTRHHHHNIHRAARRKHGLNARLEVRAKHVDVFRHDCRLARAVFRRDRDHRRGHSSVVRMREVEKHVFPAKLKRGRRPVSPINNTGVVLRAAVVERKERKRHVLPRNHVIRRNHAAQRHTCDRWAHFKHGQVVRAARAPVRRHVPDLIHSLWKRPRPKRVGSIHRHWSAAALSGSHRNVVGRADHDIFWAHDFRRAIRAFGECSGLDHHRAVVQSVLQITDHKLDVVRLASHDVVAVGHEIQRVAVKVCERTAVLKQPGVLLVVDGVDGHRLKRGKRRQVGFVARVVLIINQELELVVEDVVHKLRVLIRQEHVLCGDALRHARRDCKFERGAVYRIGNVRVGRVHPTLVTCRRVGRPVLIINQPSRVTRGENNARLKVEPGRAQQVASLRVVDQIQTDNVVLHRRARDDEPWVVSDQRLCSEQRFLVVGKRRRKAVESRVQPWETGGAVDVNRGARAVTRAVS
mmetsp:Transcript_10968/g.23471  ORF Transcript_10968/g.23471 Transcript_10968/m.23471 type:complete len:507 (-) Transcript_10968:273-1793(-)